MSTKFRVVLGLAGIIVSLVMSATYLGLIPDRVAAIRVGRTVLAESIAVHSTAMVMKKDLKQLGKDLELMAERNNDLLSLGLRQESGQTVSATAGHEDKWQNMEGEYSRESQVRVPIWSGDKKWGELELYFQPLNEPGLTGVLNNPFIRLLLFMGGGCFIIFYFYLGKVLSLLDPSKAVPGRVRTALDTMAEGLLVLDRKEQIVLANLAFAELVDKPPEKLLGQLVNAFPWQDVNGDKLQKNQRPWVIAIKKGAVQKDQVLHLVLPSRKRLIFKINCSPVLGTGKKYAGVLVSFDDITPLEEKKIELEKSRKEAESANQAKSEFLANMSHEIRTPMNAILGFTEILKRGYVKNEQDSLKYLNIINSSGKNLLDLINDILDLSKVESGRQYIEVTKTEPHPIIQDVLQVLGIQAREKSIALEFKANGLQPQTIATDPVRLRQIILNLAGNAVKFTEEGKVTVDCRLHNDGAKPSLIISVTDTGIGIEEDKIETVFDPFVQANAETTRHYGGTGLGLAISRKFAKALGGDITVESMLGEGSCFTITLPTGDLQDVPLLAPEEIIVERQLDEGKRMRWQFPKARVLVVDDGPENRQLVRFLLEEAGLEIDEADNGQRCLAMVPDQEYDLILMDVQMPVMDGFTAAKILRRQGVKIPIIALTANAMKGFEDQCLEAGYSGYQSKPIEIDRFLQYLADRLGGVMVSEEESVPTMPIQSSAPETQADQSTDASPIHSRLPQENIQFRRIIALFTERLGEQLQAMEQCIEQNDMAEVARLAHTLKGSGGTVGFDVFTDPAARLEMSARAGDAAEAARILPELHALATRLVTPESDEAPSSLAAAPVLPSTPDSRKAKTQPSPIQLPPVVSRYASYHQFQVPIQQFTEKLKDHTAKLEQAWQHRNMEEVADLANWMKGAAGTMGYDDFTEPATMLEEYAGSGKIEESSHILKQIIRLAGAVVAPQSTDLKN